MASDASSEASGAQAASAAQSDATQRYQYDTTRADNAPFRETGLQANNKLAYLMGLGGSSQSVGDIGGGLWGGGFTAAADPNKDPAYGSLSRKFTTSDMNADPVYQSGLQFGLDEGTKGINRQAAAGGSMLSGATLKALTRFGNDYGSTKANESYNRFNTDQTNQYNRLAGLSGAGQQATNQVSAAGQNMANNISASQIGAGNARASGYVGAANGWNNAISQGINGYQQNQLMGKIFPSGGGSGYGGAGITSRDTMSELKSYGVF